MRGHRVEPGTQMSTGELARRIEADMNLLRTQTNHPGWAANGISHDHARAVVNALDDLPGRMANVLENLESLLKARAGQLEGHGRYEGAGDLAALEAVEALHKAATVLHQAHDPLARAAQILDLISMANTTSTGSWWDGSDT